MRRMANGIRTLVVGKHRAVMGGLTTARAAIATVRAKSQDQPPRPERDAVGQATSNRRVASHRCHSCIPRLAAIRGFYEVAVAYRAVLLQRGICGKEEEHVTRTAVHERLSPAISFRDRDQLLRAPRLGVGRRGNPRASDRVAARLGRGRGRNGIRKRQQAALVAVSRQQRGRPRTRAVGFLEDSHSLHRCHGAEPAQTQDERQRY